MKLRWCLPPLAVFSLAGVLWISTQGGGPDPRALLDSARARLAIDPPDQAERALARRELDEALRLAQASGQAELRAAVLDERSRAHAEDGLLQLALADCTARLAEWGATTEALTRACELCLRLGEPGLALEHAEHLAAIDPALGQPEIGRCRVALADLPLAALARLAESELLPSRASEATALAQRAAVFPGGPGTSSALLEELLELFPRPDERRRAGEWVSEAADHLGAARSAFVASLAPSSGEATAGLQDLLLRGGALREAADLGLVTLSSPALARPLPVLARTASALVALEQRNTARGLVLDLKKRAPDALDPEDLPSLALRDELEEWCRLLLKLELWEELRLAAHALRERAEDGADPARVERAWLLAATAELRQDLLPSAKHSLDSIDPNPRGERDHVLHVWLARAELARRQGERSQERYALLLVTRTVPLDPPPPVRAEIGRAWQRLAELHSDEGNLAAAEVSLTHALRCSSERAAEVGPLWHEMGRKALATGGASSPYMLYTRARNQDALGQSELALADARALLAAYPGLGPALEIVSHAAHALGDYPLLIEVSLELMERGWPAEGASARLRSVPSGYFLPQDRVRWMLLDPRGSLEAVVRTLLAKGDVDAAGLAVRGGPAELQPPEALPFMARVAYFAGEPAAALAMLELLPATSAPFRSCTALALRIALLRSTLKGQAGTLPAIVAKVVASGRAEDPELPSALDAMLASERWKDAESLLAWLAPQSPPFLGELLLRYTAARALAQRVPPVDDDLERAAALLDDGRPEIGRLVLAHERGDGDALAREARAVLDTPIGRMGDPAESPAPADDEARSSIAASALAGLSAPEPAPFSRPAARRAALSFLAGEPAVAADLLASHVPDGRELLSELVLACLASRAPDEPPSGGVAPLSQALLEAVSAEQLLVLALSLEYAPWNAWAHVRLQALAARVPDDGWLKALVAEGWLSLSWPGRARATLGPSSPDGETDARLAWLRAEVQRNLGASPDVVREADLAWLTARGRSSAEDPGSVDPDLAPLEAAQAARRGAHAEAARILAAALEQRPGDPELTLELAELENTSGKRTRACELYSLLLSSESSAATITDDERVLAYLDTLRAARDEGEISEERWWSEVEALEAERPEDPAPVRELAARTFERADREGTTGRQSALEHLARFRARTLDRPLETLRRGEGERWIELLARRAPERALPFAEEELRRDPANPGLWRASAVALLAAGRARAAFERLRAVHAVAPEPETARLLALTGLRVENDPAAFAARLTEMKSFDPRVEDSAELTFYGALFAARDEDEGIARALDLWRARTENGLAAPEHGRALALRLFYAGKREPALVVLDDARTLVQSALERDVLEALSYVMRNAPEAPRPVQGARPPAGPRADDAPARKPAGSQPGAAASGSDAARAKAKDERGSAGAKPAQPRPAAGAKDAPKERAENPATGPGGEVKSPAAGEKAAPRPQGQGKKRKKKDGQEPK